MFVLHSFNLLVLTLAALVQGQNDNFTCQEGKDPTSINGQPPLPEQFSVTIEAAIGRWNRTMVLKEYYDRIGQRGRIDGHINFRGDSYRKFSYILDYDTDQGFHVMYSDDSVNCTVVPLENDRIVNFTFREFPGPNGTVRIGSVNDIFQFGGTYNATYVGQYYMRGILCDRWQHCFESPNMTYRTDYYFSVEDWSFPNNASRVPVVITVNGLNVRNGSNHTVANTYTFTEFTPGPPEDGMLSVPEGLVCKNRKQLKKLPSLDVEYLSAHIESTYGNGTFYSLLFYDKMSNLVRFDYTQNPRFTRSPPSKMTTIHDFTQGVQYSINRTSSLCNISAIEPRTAFFPDETIDETGNVVLSSLFDLLSPQVNSTDSYVYEGESTVRGIPAEVWISFADEYKYRAFNFTFYNITLQLYFTKEQYAINGRQSVQIPILQRTSGVVQGVFNNSQFTRQFSGESGIYEYDPTEPAYEVFDAFVCYDTSATKELTFILPVAAMGMDFTNLRGRIRSALSAATGSPGSQFSNIQIQPYSTSSVLVTLLLLDTPQIMGKSQGKTSQQLYDNIMSLLRQGSLKVTINNKSTVASPQSAEQTPTQPINVVGVGVGCFFGGLLLGVLVVTIIIGTIFLVRMFKKKNTREAYFPQKDDI